MGKSTDNRGLEAKGKGTPEITPRFGNIAAQLKAKVEPVVEAESRRSLKGLAKVREQDNVVTAEKVELEKSEIYKILISPDLDPKEKAEKIAALLEFNETDLAKNPEAIAQTVAIISQLMHDFKEFNKAAMQLVHDNPLSELGTDIGEVFEKYHEIVGSREDLDERLKLIDEVLAKHGGAEGLVQALHNAKDKEAERADFLKRLEDARGKVDGLNGELRTANGSVRALERAVQDAESDGLLFLKGEKKRQLREDKRRLREIEAEAEVKRTELEEGQTELQAMSDEYATLIEGADFQLHQKILEILDIGSGDFKEQIKRLAALTIGYINDTENILAGSRDQIKLLLTRGEGLLNMIQNTGEQVKILLEGQNIAQGRNTEKMELMRAGLQGMTGMEALKREKVITALNSHITSTGRGVQSTATIGSKLVEIETGQISFVDRLHEGLSEAQEQEMLSVGNAAMTGVATLSRVESFAAAIPGLIAKGQYQQDSEYAFGQLSKEFERALSAKMAGNASIESFTKTVRDLRESMSERNDLDIQITTQRKELIDTMIGEAERLGKANEAALSIESTVNDLLYGQEAKERVAAAQGPAAAPA